MKILLLILVLGFAAFGQKTIVSVSIDVQSTNKDLQNTVQSYIEREVRSLRDVEIKSKDSFYSISIIVLENETQSGYKNGYTLSTVVTWHTTCQTFNKIDTYPCEIFDDHLINLAPTDGLRGACERIITNFDTRSVKPLRAK